MTPDEPAHVVKPATPEQIQAKFGAMNRAERRRFGKATGVKIVGTNKPWVNPKRKTVADVYNELQG